MLFRGKKIIDCNTFNDLDEKKLPNRDNLIAWILNAIPLNINSYQVQLTVRFLLKQAQESIDKKRVLPSLKNAKSVKLEKVPESELTRPQPRCWVLNRGPTKEEKEVIHSCPFCGYNINKCPNCGISLIEKTSHM